MFVFSWGAAKDGKVIKEPQWDAVELILDRIHAEGFGFDGILAEVMGIQEEESYFHMSSVEIMGEEDYYMARYADEINGKRMCRTRLNPDPNDKGEVRLGGNDWGKCHLRKGFGFLRAIFEEYISARRIPLTLFDSKQVFD